MTTSLFSKATEVTGKNGGTPTRAADDDLKVYAMVYGSSSCANLAELRAS